MSIPTEDLAMYFGNVVNQRLDYLDDNLRFRSIGDEAGKINVCINNFENIRNRTVDDLCNSNFRYNSLQNCMLINHSRNVRPNADQHFYPAVVQDLSRHCENIVYQSQSNIGPLDYSNNYRNNYSSNLLNEMSTRVGGNCKEWYLDSEPLKRQTSNGNVVAGTNMEHVVHLNRGNSLNHCEVNNNNDINFIQTEIPLSFDGIKEAEAVYSEVAETASQELNRVVESKLQSEKHLELDENICTARVECTDSEPNININIICEEVVSILVETVERILNLENEETSRNREVDLVEHSEKATNKQVVVPDINALKNSLKTALSRGMKKNKAKKVRRTNRCLECPRIFSTSDALAKHVIRKHLNKTIFSANTDISVKKDQKLKGVGTVHANKTLLHCNKCKCYFSDRNELKVHALIHLKERRLKCNVCGLSFKNRRDLDEHSLLHNKKPACCEICGKTFSQAGNMKIHLRIHTKEKPYTCQHCGKSYAQSGDLKTHIRVHTDERPYLCEYCGNLFHSLSHLARHSKVHTKEKPYTCTVCGHSFAHAHHLKKHYRIHTQEKPYNCEICGKAFSRADYVKQHIRVHTKEKPYICRICGKGFSQGGSLKLHQRVHTRQGSIL